MGRSPRSNVIYAQAARNFIPHFRDLEMSSFELNEVIRTSDVVVHRGRFAYLKCSEKPGGSHFLVSQDSDEVTVVTNEQHVEAVKYAESTKWFKLLEIRVSKPFIAKGFLAKISTTISAKNLNVLLVSTYSKDYALVREETADIAIQALEEVGFPIRFA